MVNRERDDNIYYARLAEQGERYEDMIRYMKDVANVSTLPSRSHPGTQGPRRKAELRLPKLRRRRLSCEVN